MKADLEDYLWNRISKHDFRISPFVRIPGESPREVIKEMIALGLIKCEKQAHRTLKKWIGKGKYNYGALLDMGWGEIQKHNE